MTRMVVLHGRDGLPIENAHIFTQTPVWPDVIVRDSDRTTYRFRNEDHHHVGHYVVAQTYWMP